MAEESIRLGLLKHIMRVEENYPLQHFNQLKAGGVADYFTVALNTVELASAVKAAIDISLPYIIVGQGEGILFSDGGFPGLVIHNQTSSIGVAGDKSQIVADSGLSLNRFITLAAEKGLGGLTHLYGEKASVGGALYANLAANGRPIISSVRYVTMLMPPARIDKEATIVRYKREWLEKSAELTKLQFLKSSRTLNDPQPVILTILFQLTNVRADELRQRLQERQISVPKGPHFGPLFDAPPGVPVEELLVGANVAEIRVGGIYPNRYAPNYLVSTAPINRAMDIREVITRIQELVATRYGVGLSCRYEYGGVW